jgi:fructokinase
VIAVTGEALIDLVAGTGGQITARPGGGPFNTARTIGRLGLSPVFLGRLSADRFGRQLRAALDADGVTPAVPEPADAPTTLAVVDRDPRGTSSIWTAPPLPHWSTRRCWGRSPPA